jgi:small-conductance mechanosensitive channel
MIHDFLNTFNLSFKGFLRYLPALIGGIAIFVITLFVANIISKWIAKYSLRRTNDQLIANFIGKIGWAVIFILGTVLSLGILGLGTISNKILAGAGITTFVIGFALKDIGENFLAGLIIAFSRPFHVGNLIECQDVKGIVRNMTLRQTTVEADNGKVIMIPNSSIIKNPLSIYTADNKLRQEFIIMVNPDNAREAMKIIEDTIDSYEHVLHTTEKRVVVLADSMSTDKVKISAVFWFDTDRFTGSKSATRSDILLEVFSKLKQADIIFSGA